MRKMTNPTMASDDETVRRENWKESLSSLKSSMPLLNTPAERLSVIITVSRLSHEAKVETIPYCSSDIILVNMGPLIRESPFNTRFAKSNAMEAFTTGDAVLNFLIIDLTIISFPAILFETQIVFFRILSTVPLKVFSLNTVDAVLLYFLIT